MRSVIILKGLPASGKTTYAKKLISENPVSFKRISKDDLRNMFDNKKWSKNNEKFILEVRDILIIKALEAGKHVIVDDTNLDPKHESQIKKLVGKQALVNTVTFNITLEEAIKRDLERTDSVGEKVIKEMYNKYLKPQPLVYVPPKNKPKAFVFDIDGTLAIKSNRSPFDWSRVGEDKVSTNVFEVFKTLSSSKDYKILIFTGRDAICENETIAWLMDNKIEYNQLCMRQKGDNRKDAIIKKEMFDKIKSDYNIIGVFDDRKQVKRMWTDLGLFVFDVNQTDEEF